MPRIKGPDGIEFDVAEGASEADVLAAWKAKGGGRAAPPSAGQPTEAPDSPEPPAAAKPGILHELIAPSAGVVAGIPSLLRELMPTKDELLRHGGNLPMAVGARIGKALPGVVGNPGGAYGEPSGMLGAISEGSRRFWQEPGLKTGVVAAATAPTGGASVGIADNIANSPHPVARAIGEAIPLVGTAALGTAPVRGAVTRGMRAVTTPVAKTIGKVTNAEKWAGALAGTEKTGVFNPAYESEIRAALAAGEITEKQAAKLRETAKKLRVENKTVPEMPLSVSERVGAKGEVGQRAREIESRLPNAPGGGLARQFRDSQQTVSDQWRGVLQRRTGSAGDLDSLHTSLKQQFEAIYDANKQRFGTELRTLTQDVDKVLGKPSVPSSNIVTRLQKDLAEWGKFPAKTVERDAYDIAMMASAEGRLSIENAWLLRRKLDEMLRGVRKGSVPPEKTMIYGARQELSKLIEDTFASAGKPMQKKWKEANRLYAENEQFRKRTFVKKMIESHDSLAVASTIMNAVPEDISLVMRQLPKRMRGEVRNTILGDTFDALFKMSEPTGERLSGQAFVKEFGKRFPPEKLNLLFDPLQRAEIRKFVDVMSRTADPRKSMSPIQAIIGFNVVPARWVGAEQAINRSIAKALLTPGGMGRFQRISDLMKRLKATEMTPELAQQIQAGAYGALAARELKQLIADAQAKEEGATEDPLELLYGEAN